MFTLFRFGECVSVKQNTSFLMDWASLPTYATYASRFIDNWQIQISGLHISTFLRQLMFDSLYALEYVILLAFGFSSDVKDLIDQKRKPILISVILVLSMLALALKLTYYNLVSDSMMFSIWSTLGSGCDSVGRVVASNSRGPRFESSHWQKFILNIYCQLYWKDENKEKEAGNGPFLKNIYGAL